MSDVDRIKERLNIGEVIGAYVELKPSGQYLKGKSPFSNERTPSFFVSPDKGLYHCFSTDKGGDVFTFIQEMEGVDFPGALKILADKAGITLQKGKTSERQRGREDRLREIMKEARDFYCSNLRENERAADYIKERGISEQTAQEFAIGYAPDEWHGVHEYLKGKGYKDNDLKEAGLLARSQKKDDNYDRFRDRVMFPLEDTAGRVVAFSGRTLKENKETPKYINSPETPIFSKSHVLFGYSRAKRSLRKFDFGIVVEGQIDLVLCHQAGYRNTVAPSGTATTAEQLNLIKRFTKNVLFAYDSDEAGITAARKASQTALGLEMTPKIAVLPEGGDPADIIVSNPDEWKRIVKEAEHVVDAELARINSTTDDQSKRVRLIKKRVLPLLGAFADEMDQDVFVRRVQDETGLTERSIRENMSKSSSKRSSYGGASTQQSSQSSEKSSKQKKSRQEQILEKLLTIIEWQDSKDDPDVDVEAARKQISKLQDDLSETFPPLPEIAPHQTVGIEAMYNRESDVIRDVDELLLHLEEVLLVDEYATRRAQLKTSKDKEEKKEILAHCNQLFKQIHEIRDKLGDSSATEVEISPLENS